MVLTLSLTNIRCWEGNHKFKFETNFVLLSGQSGKGKTSILESILYALYGKVTKICTEGKTKCRVVMTLHTPTVKIKIDRSKGPNKLIVDGKYDGTSGQKVIDRVFGSHKKFMLSSYIKQKSQNSFMNLSPTDKLEFIESLAMSENTSTNIKSHVKESIKNIQTELVCKQSEIKSLTEIIKTTHHPGEKIGMMCDLDYLTKLKDEVVDKTNLESRIHSNISIYNKQILDYTRRKAQLDESEKTKIDCKNEIENLDYVNVDMNLYNEDYKLLVKLDKEKKTREALSILKSFKKNIKLSLNEENSKMDSYERQFKDKDIDLEELYTYIKEIVSIESDVSGCCVVPQNIEEKLKDNIRDMEYLNNSISVLNRNAEISSKTLKCPECKHSLTLRDNLLVVENTTTNTTTKARDEICKELKLNKERLQKVKILIDSQTIELDRYKKYTYYLKKSTDTGISICKPYKKFKNELKHRIKKKKELVKLISISTDKINGYKKILQKIKNRTYNKIPELSYIHSILTEFLMEDEGVDVSSHNPNHDIDRQYRDVMKRVEVVKENIVQNKMVKKREQKLIDKISILEEYINKNEHISQELDKLSEKIHDNNKKLKTIRHDIDSLRIVIDKCNMYIEWKGKEDSYNKINDKIKENSLQEDKIVKNLTVYNTLKELISRAESMSINSIVNTINIHVRDYLDDFFREDPISVEIKTFKEVKNNKKPQINIDVGYKSMKCDPTILSGGEYDRVQMAFTLSIADIVKSPLVLLDESVSSLDEETSSLILESIRTGLQNKSIINVAHQVCSGSFTEIVKL